MARERWIVRMNGFEGTITEWGEKIPGFKYKTVRSAAGKFNQRSKKMNEQCVRSCLPYCFTKFVAPFFAVYLNPTKVALLRENWVRINGAHCHVYQEADIIDLEKNPRLAQYFNSRTGLNCFLSQWLEEHEGGENWDPTAPTFHLCDYRPFGDDFKVWKEEY